MTKPPYEPTKSDIIVVSVFFIIVGLAAVYFLRGAVLAGSQVPGWAIGVVAIAIGVCGVLSLLFPKSAASKNVHRRMGRFGELGSMFDKSDKR